MKRGTTRVPVNETKRDVLSVVAMATELLNVGAVVEISETAAEMTVGVLNAGEWATGRRSAKVAGTTRREKTRIFLLWTRVRWRHHRRIPLSG